LGANFVRAQGAATLTSMRRIKAGKEDAGTGLAPSVHIY